MSIPPAPASVPLISPERYLAIRRPVEISYWLVSCLLSAVGNSVTLQLDVAREGLGYAPWQVATWETSSALAVLLLVPALIAFTAHWPVHLDNWRRRLSLYIVASLAWSLLHVGLMVTMRMLVYRWYGDRYHFDWALGYEYMKDARTFLGLVVMLHIYRMLVRRLQGEASLLTAPEDGSPIEPPGRPERFLVRKLGREFLVVAGDIEWVQASGNYTNLHVRGRVYPLRSTLTALQAQLDPALFVRVHRSYLINLSQIASVEPLDSGDACIHLRDGTRVPCSRRYREAVR